MFDLDIGKIVLVAVVALVVVGPKELPLVLRTLGQAVGRLRSLQSTVRRALADVMAEADLDEVGTDLRSLEKGLWTSIAANPATSMRGTLPAHAEAAIAASASYGGIVQYASAEMEAYLSPTTDKRPKVMDESAR